MRAASRLHFGMLSFGQQSVRQFGGAGVMIDEPALRIRVSTADELQVNGAMADRVRAVIRRLGAAWEWEHPPNCRIEVVQAPREHAGFGAGTQLALALAAALARWTARTSASVEALAQATGRAQRSAIGTWGFARGGLLVEAGHEPAEEEASLPALSPLVDRVALPAEWRWVLVTPTSAVGLSGTPELEAFSRLPPVPIAVTEQLCDELWRQLRPAAHRGDFQSFSASLYRYGTLAGTCFAAVQGGAFANGHVARLVERIRGLGVEGVGQTSWGPTVFALVPDEQRARSLVEQLKSASDDSLADIRVSQTCNSGAEIVERELEPQ